MLPKRLLAEWASLTCFGILINDTLTSSYENIQDE